MMRLKSKLLSLNASKTNKVKIFSPRNCEELRIPFKTDKKAKVVGKLASMLAPNSKLSSDDLSASEPQSQVVSGVLVENDFKLSLMYPQDLHEYAGLTTTTLTCKQRLKLTAAGVDLIKWALEGTYGSVQELPLADTKGKTATNGSTVNGSSKEMVAAYEVMGCVKVLCYADKEIELEWEGNSLNDGIADSVMTVLFGVESSPAAVKRTCCYDIQLQTHGGLDSIY
jgi:cleavage and polyadenylation specificity factor subunit 3